MKSMGPERLRDTPISERGFVGMCTGAAMTGTRPIVDFMFIDFILDAMGELINQVSKIQYMSSGRLKMPVMLARLYWHRWRGGDPSLGQLFADLCPHSGLPRGHAQQRL